MLFRSYLGGDIPKPPDDTELTDAETDLRRAFANSMSHMERSVDLITPTQAAKAAFSFVRKANAYVELVAPWKLAKEESDRRRLEVVLYELVESLRLMALLLSPFIPRAAQELWERLGQDGEVATLTFDLARWGLLSEGTKIVTGDPLFPRIEAS